MSKKPESEVEPTSSEAHHPDVRPSQNTPGKFEAYRPDGSAITSDGTRARQFRSEAEAAAALEQGE